MAAHPSMTGRPASRRPVLPAAGGVPRVVPAALLLLTAVIGLVIGMNPAVGMLVALGVVFALVVMRDLALGVCGFLLLTFLDVVSTNSDLSLTKVGGALLAASWLATLAARGGTRRVLLADAPWLTAILVAFLAWSGLSAIWAESPAEAVGSTLRFALNALLVPIVYFAVRDRRHVTWVFAVFVVGTLLSVAWGVATEPTAGSAAAAQTGRLVGARVEANALATLLLVAVVFAGALALAAPRRVAAARPIALAAAVIGLTAFFATFSRAGIVALATVLIVGVFYAGRWRSGLVALMLVAVLVGTAYVSASGSGAVDRLTSANTSGRGDLWTVGWRMVTANPIAGVGSGNYTTVEARYLIYPGTVERDDLILDKPLVAHNIYLHVLAEMGVVGLALFMAILLICLSSAARAVGMFRRRGERSLEVLARALVVALVGILVADFFVSEQYSKQLWLLLAMGPALLAIAREGRGQRARR
jgi:O-antigen ligase